MGKGKGRRLKRYLGLRRSQEIVFQGGIDRLLPGRLMGWVMASDSQVSFYEVRLLVGPHLISRVEINQPRPDVCEQLGQEGNFGFVLPLPVDLPPLNWNEPIRVVAVSVDGSARVELPLMQKKVKPEESLRAVLQSDQRGMDGHVDGIRDGALVGWAGHSGQLKPAKIWLQAEGLEPIGVVCSQCRKGMSTQKMPSECGFSQTLDALPGSWAGKSIWFSFDKAGQWPIPQEQAFFAPSLVRKSEVNLAHQDSESVNVAAITYADQIVSAPKELQEHWRNLENFGLFLDGLEEELNRRDELRAQRFQVKGNRLGWFGRLLRPVRYR